MVNDQRRDISQCYDDLHRNWYSNIESSSGLDILHKWEKGKLLDIGCGSGALLKAASDNGFEVSGIDISEVAVDMAKKNAPKAEIVMGIAEQLPFSEDSFDYLTCIGSLEHFIDPKKAAHEMSRVLKTGGEAVILVPNSHHLEAILNNSLYGISGHDGQLIEHLYTREQWRDLLEEAGLRVVAIEKRHKIYPPGSRSMKELLLSMTQRFLPATLSYAMIFNCHQRVLTEDNDRWSCIIIPKKVPPIILQCNKKYESNFIVKNNGFKVWHTPETSVSPVNFGCLLKDHNGNIYYEGRVPLRRPLVPGKRQKLTIEFPTPKNPGEYIITWDLVCEWKFWFREMGNIPVEKKVIVE